MNAVKEVILANLSQIPEDEPIAVALSAGIDSTSIFAALMELQRYVTVYSFTLNGWMSRDFAIARDNARRVGAGFIPVFLPTDIDTLKADVHKLVGHYHLKKKADIECAWPWMYLIKTVHENHIATGLCSDAFFGLSRRARVHFGLTGKMDEWRELVYDGNPNYSQLLTIRKMAAERNKTVWAPYREPEMRHLFDGMQWNQLNQPKEKMPIRNAFADWFQKFPVYPHANLQLGDSRIAEQFERLLLTEENPGGKYQSVVGVYNEIIRKHKPGPKNGETRRTWGQKKRDASERAAKNLMIGSMNHDVEDEDDNG